MKDYYVFLIKDNQLCIDKIQEMTELLNKRLGLVNFAVKDSYKDDKKDINLVSFEWVSEKVQCLFVFSSLLSVVFSVCIF